MNDEVTILPAHFGATDGVSVEGALGDEAEMLAVGGVVGHEVEL